MDITTLSTGASMGNCHILTDGKTAVFLDVGISWHKIKAALGFRLAGTPAALVTHEHKDHIFAARLAAEAGIDIYASAGTIEAEKLSGHRIHTIQGLEWFDLGTMRVMPFAVDHNAVEPLGFVIESRVEGRGSRFVYATDFARTKYRLPGVTDWLVECNFDEASMNMAVNAGCVKESVANYTRIRHMSLERLLKMFRENDMAAARRIILTHISGRNADPQRMHSAVAAAVPWAKVYIAGKGENYGA